MSNKKTIDNQFLAALLFAIIGNTESSDFFAAMAYLLAMAFMVASIYKIGKP